MMLNELNTSTMYYKKKKKYASKENFLAVEIRESSDVDGEVQLPLLYYGEKG